MSSSLRARMTVALTFAAGAFLYFSDHDTIDRHWRLALALTLGAVLLAVSPLWISARSTGRTARVLVLAVVVLAGGSGCGTSRAVRGAGAAMSAGLGGIVLADCAMRDRPGTDTSEGFIGTALGLIALGAILGISAGDPGPVPSGQTPAQAAKYAGLPAPAAGSRDVHAVASVD